MLSQWAKTRRKLQKDFNQLAKAAEGLRRVVRHCEANGMFERAELEALDRTLETLDGVQGNLQARWGFEVQGK